MASSSRNINMPLIFAITIGATVAIAVSTMFGLAWYQYESRQVLEEQVINTPTHGSDYLDALAQQQANLTQIDQAIQQIASEQTKQNTQAQGQGPDTTRLSKRD